MRELAKIPPRDRLEFERLPYACRKNVQALLRVVAKLIAHGAAGIQAAIKSEAAGLGVSPRTLRGDYDAFRHSRDWRVLVDYRKYPRAREPKIPVAVVDLFQLLREIYGRKSRPAWRELIGIWRREVASGNRNTWKTPWPPVNPGTKLPCGCTCRNLMRQALDRARIDQRKARVSTPEAGVLRIEIGFGKAKQRGGSR